MTAGERMLRDLVRSSSGVTVLTGGQTGVDTLAARAALRAGLPVHLVFPLGFRQEDGRLTASRRHGLRGASMHELGSASFRYRTWTLVYLCDAVVLLDPAGGEGCQQTAMAAGRLGRPLLRPAARIGSAEIATWLEQAGARVLLIAGCRASLIAGHGAGSGLQDQVTAVTDGASERHRRLLRSVPPRAPGGPGISI